MLCIYLFELAFLCQPHNADGVGQSRAKFNKLSKTLSTCLPALFFALTLFFTATLMSGQTNAQSADIEYGQKVEAHLAGRTGPILQYNGKTLIIFEVASDGSLARSSIAKSSGFKALDRLALQQVQSAAPFPPPPTGVVRKFSIYIKGHSQPFR